MIVPDKVHVSKSEARKTSKMLIKDISSEPSMVVKNILS
jgi:hypothetical protein